ncbi:MAG: hypothetical protein VX278_23535 [Myxococcota bacterium]|nr:hypothetical protein [Myxococcota bacterium]
MNSTDREDDLETEIRYAIEDAVIGERLDSSLIGRVKTVVRAILLRRGLGAARTQVELSGTGLNVRITLPPNVPRVRMIRLSFGGDTFAGI